MRRKKQASLGGGGGSQKIKAVEASGQVRDGRSKASPGLNVYSTHRDSRTKLTLSCLDRSLQSNRRRSGGQDHDSEDLGHREPGKRGKFDEAGSASPGEPGMPRAGQRGRHTPPAGPSSPRRASRVAAKCSPALEERQPGSRGQSRPLQEEHVPAELPLARGELRAPLTASPACSCTCEPSLHGLIRGPPRSSAARLPRVLCTDEPSLHGLTGAPPALQSCPRPPGPRAAAMCCPGPPARPPARLPPARNACCVLPLSAPRPHTESLVLPPATPESGWAHPSSWNLPPVPHWGLMPPS